MASVMQRPRSTQPTDLTYNDDSRGLHHRNTLHGQNQSQYPEVSGPPPLGTSELGEQLADLQRELLGAQSSSTAGDPASALLASSSDPLGLSGKDQGGAGPSGSEGMTGRILGLGDSEEASSSMGLLDDPAVIALVEQSSHLDSDFELNLAAQALSSQVPKDLPRPLSDLDFASTGTFQFPELPASLLDQAPEYEYSVHTQANVFDAVQDYDPAGDDEAARMFSLDHYDPALLELPNQASVGNEDFWNYHDGSTAGSMVNPGQMSDYANFHDSSSLSDYPEPSTAPTSRASDWKHDPATADLYPSMQTSFGTPANFPMKRRRESFDASINQAGSAGMYMSGYSHPVDHQAQLYSMQGYEDGRHGVRADARKSSFIVPSQGGPVVRTRMTNWGDESSGHYTDSWPPPPAPAPMTNASTGGFRPSGQMLYPNDIHGGSAFAPPTSMPAGTGMMNMTMAPRVSSGSSDGSGPSAATAHNGGGSPGSAARHASQNEMINALGSAMDASMESDGVAKCPYPNCTKTFAKNRSYNLKAHLRSHSQLKPFACSHCPRAFSRKHDLERHARVHSGDKPYLCEACGKGFPRSDALRRHWRVEKECGEKAVEIEAGQPLPSLPPGVNTVAAQAKVAMPGMMPPNGPTTTAVASNMSAPSHPMMMSSYPSFSAPQGWENGEHGYGGAAGGYAYQQRDRKRSRQDY